MYNFRLQDLQFKQFFFFFEKKVHKPLLKKLAIIGKKNRM